MRMADEHLANIHIWVDVVDANKENPDVELPNELAREMLDEIVRLRKMEAGVLAGLNEVQEYVIMVRDSPWGRKGMPAYSQGRMEAWQEAVNIIRGKIE